MSRALLIVANSDEHTDRLAREAVAAGFTVVVAAGEPAAADKSGRQESAGRPPIHRVVWNRRSPLSARAVLVQAANIVSPISDIVYLHTPQAMTAPFHEIKASYFETIVDIDTRGRLFILKESLAYLQRVRRGSLTLLFHGRVGAETAPLQAEGAGAFLSLGSSLFTQYQNEPIRLRGLQSAGAPIEQFARFAIQQIGSDTPRQRGRWLKYSARPALFPFPR